MNKFLLITYYWPPAGGAGVQRWLGLSKYLPENGWEPVVLTVRPDCATYPQRDESLLKEVPNRLEVVRTKSIEPLQWYGQLAGKDRIPYGGFSNEKPNSWTSRFVRGNFFIPDARRGWNGYALSAARKLIKQHDIKLVVTTGPPHSTHLIGLSLQKKMGIKWVADMRDPWTQVYYNFDMPRTSLAVRYDRMLERQVLSRADAVVTASPGFADMFATIVARKYEVITNGYTRLLPKKDKPSGSPLYITYTGTVAESYRPETLFAALATLDKSLFRLRVAGSIAPGVLALIDKHGLTGNLDFLGYLSHAEVEEELSMADVLLLLVPSVPNGEGIIPGKLFEYLAAHAPVLALVAPGSPVGEILRETGAGKAFDHADAEGIEGFLKATLALPEPRAHGLHTAKYARQALAQKFVHLFEALTSPKDSPQA